LHRHPTSRLSYEDVDSDGNREDIWKKNKKDSKLSKIKKRKHSAEDVFSTGSDSSDYQFDISCSRTRPRSTSRKKSMTHIHQHKALQNEASAEQDLLLAFSSHSPHLDSPFDDMSSNSLDDLDFGASLHSQRDDFLSLSVDKR